MSDIENPGGKTSSLLAQLNAGNEDMVFPLSLNSASDYDRGIRREYDFTGPQIVRGSAPGDENGQVDVQRTFRNQSSPDITSRIGEVIGSSRDPKVVEYAKWEGVEDYKGVSSVIIQPENQYKEVSIDLEPLRGSVLEHPNIEGHYVINIVRRTQFGNTFVDQYLVDDRAETIKSKTTGGSLDPRKNLIQKIIEMKQRARKAGFIPSTHSSQVEFGVLNPNQDLENEKYDYPNRTEFPVVLYQEREFRPYDFDPSIDPSLYPFNFFGNIPEEGIELPLVLIDERYPNPEEQTDEPSAYVFGSCITNSAPLSFMPDNMEAFIVGAGRNADTLEHNTYRWAQKARYSFLLPKSPMNIEIIKLKPEEKRNKIRITRSDLVKPEPKTDYIPRDPNKKPLPKRKTPLKKSNLLKPPSEVMGEGKTYRFSTELS